MSKTSDGYRSELLERLTPGSRGTATLGPIEVSEHDAAMSIFSGAPVHAGTYVRLVVNGVTMMSDTQMEQRTNWEFLRRAHGHILIAGLGIGYLLHELENPKGGQKRFESVTIVEKNADVIALVAPAYTSQAFKIIHGDIFEWLPPKGTKYDVLYFDIWSSICEDNLKEMATLGRRFGPFRNKDNPRSWLECWSRPEMRANARSSYKAVY